MNQLSWPAVILIGLILGLIAVAADGRDGDSARAGTTASADAAATDDADTSDGTGSPANDDTSGAASDGGPAPAGGGPADVAQPDAPAPDTGGDLADPYVVTLTFDDGPHPTYTPQVLDLLDRYDATAVFCVVGEPARAHPKLLNDIVDAGHVLCNHSDTHDPDLGDRPPEVIEREIVTTNDAIGAAVDADVRYFRQPTTYVEPNVLTIASRHGLEPLDWTIDPRDWTRPGAEAIVDGVLGQLAPGAVILLHDGGGNRTQTVAALEPILRGINLAGYRYVMPGDRP